MRAANVDQAVAIGSQVLESQTIRANVCVGMASDRAAKRPRRSAVSRIASCVPSTRIAGSSPQSRTDTVIKPSGELLHALVLLKLG